MTREAPARALPAGRGLAGVDFARIERAWSARSAVAEQNVAVLRVERPAGADRHERPNDGDFAQHGLILHDWRSDQPEVDRRERITKRRDPGLRREPVGCRLDRRCVVASNTKAIPAS